MSRSPLTAAQQQLVAEHWGLALDTAHPFTVGWERRAGDWTGAVGLALCEAATTYNPSRGAFAQYMKPRVRWAIIDMRRMDCPAGYRRVSAAPEINSLDALRAADRFDVADSGRLPVGWEAESEESVKALARRLKGRAGELLRRLYLRAEYAALNVAGRSLGLNEMDSYRLHYAAKRELRDRMTTYRAGAFPAIAADGAGCT